MSSGKKFVGHVDKVVAKYMEIEHVLDEASSEGLNFVVNTGDSDYLFVDLSDDDDGNIAE
jgi:hypothetical protein